jgi:hypothetical protein
MRKSFITAALLAAVAGSTLLSGTALAGGGSGTGGSGNNNCIPVGVNVLSGIGLLVGQGAAGAGSCSVDASGHGGNA